MKTENMYYNQQKRSEVKEEARRLRRKFLRYQQAEIVYSLSHKKLMELANDKPLFLPVVKAGQNAVVFLRDCRRSKYFVIQFLLGICKV